MPNSVILGSAISPQSPKFHKIAVLASIFCCQVRGYVPIMLKFGTCTSVATKWRHPPINSSAASLTSATGCPPTDWSWTQTRQNCCSPARSLLRSMKGSTLPDAEIRCWYCRCRVAQLVKCLATSGYPDGSIKVRRSRASDRKVERLTSCSRGARLSRDKQLSEVAL